MKVPTVRGIIDRRILVNFRIAPETLERVVPPPFRPKLVRGWGMGGICLIRLKQVRPRGMPAWFGISSENAAHRIAVEWQVNGAKREGVFIPRRDTSSRINTLAGGRIFPGLHHHSRFQVVERDGCFTLDMHHRADGTYVSVMGRLADSFPATSVFHSLHEASEFFRHGAVGYSVTRFADRFDGLELRSHEWRVEPLAVERVQSSFFDCCDLFPRGTVEFDCALLMRNILHEWHAREPLCAENA